MIMIGGHGGRLEIGKYYFNNFTTYIFDADVPLGINDDVGNDKFFILETMNIQIYILTSYLNLTLVKRNFKLRKKNNMEVTLEIHLSAVTLY